MLQTTQKMGMMIFERVESVFDKFFTQAWNPLYHLGALSFFFFWIVVFSGIYLFIFFDTSISTAYLSVESITHEHYYIGGIMRSLHRYASDAMLFLLTLHMIREFLMGRFRGARWFSWMTGVPLIWLVFASGINGYWLVWDEKAQYIAIRTSEWFDWLPIFGMPLSQNFLNENTLSDRFFSLLVFLHIGIPLFLLLMMWVHIQRMAMAKTNPPRGLAIGTLVCMVMLSIFKPALSMSEANLNQTVA
ncbi:MAG: cytochrome b N-terminal domain-containing protein, partial [Gammaproteobacteria bacterium]|nr:cytochrome b N-terminal domain-containing protein [Gammaproteobacteria bacterium]